MFNCPKFQFDPIGKLEWWHGVFSKVLINGFNLEINKIQRTGRSEMVLVQECKVMQTKARFHNLDLSIDLSALSYPACLILGLIAYSPHAGDLVIIELGAQTQGVPPSIWICPCAPISIRFGCQNSPTLWIMDTLWVEDSQYFCRLNICLVKKHFGEEIFG